MYDDSTEWEWVYCALAADLPVGFRGVTVVIVGEVATLTMAVDFNVPRPPPFPPSTTDLRLCGVCVEETDPALLPNVTRLHLATIPHNSYRIRNLEFPVPAATPSLSLPCLRQLAIEFNKKSQLEFCGLILAPVLVDLRKDSHMEGSIGHFADECTHMLHTVKQLDLGFHGFLRESDVAAVFAASPMVHEIDLVCSRALEACVIFEETI
ncbi:hypothetical protein B0H17DRAFT_1142577 [Mycena rosella]|uniref:Uncharacterized protein n=1 Tax=Mycena rosella TaxID=1033263 RepID=A0AAD7CX46_MYCRO|nr:hypothetical protein B0H17DRAFT_1142577 [Mycena rosella]